MPTATPSTRLSGNTLTFKVGSTEWMADATNVVLSWDDSDSKTVTFADAAAGNSQSGTLKGTMIQSLTATSFWRYAWANSGQVIAFDFGPGGNATPSADQPHYTGNVRIGNRPDLGGDAQINGDAWTADFSWDVIGEVTVVTTGS